MYVELIVFCCFFGIWMFIQNFKHIFNAVISKHMQIQYRYRNT